MPLGLAAKQHALEEQQSMLMAKIYGLAHSQDFSGCLVDSSGPSYRTPSPELLAGYSYPTFETDEAESHGDHGSVPPDLELPNPEPDSGTVPTKSPPKARRLHPDSAAHELYARWKEALPRLVDPLLSYMSASMGREHYVLKEPAMVCNNPASCGQESNKILCLFFSCKHILLAVLPQSTHGNA